MEGTRKYLSKVDAAEYIGIGTRFLGRLLAEGRIPERRIGRRVLLGRDDLDAFMESRKATRTQRA